MFCRFYQVVVVAVFLSQAVALATEVPCTLEYAEDPTRTVPVSQAKDLFYSPMPATLSKGYSDSYFWIRVKCQNLNDQDELVYAVFSYPVLQYVKHYSGNELLASVGLLERFNRLKTRLPVVSILVPAQSQSEDYIRVSTKLAVVLSLKNYSASEYISSLSKESLGYGVYFGLIGLIVAFAYLLWILSRFVYRSKNSNLFLSFAIYVTINIIYQLSYAGFSGVYFWPNSVFLKIHTVTVLSPLVLATLIVYVKSFLVPGSINKLLLYFLLLLTVIQIPNCLWGKVSVASVMITYTAALVFFYLAAYSLCFVICDFTLYNICLALGITSYCICFFVLIARNLGYVGATWFSIHVQEIGTLVDLVMLSLAMLFRQFREQSKFIASETLQSTLRSVFHELKRPFKIVQTELKLNGIAAINPIISECIAEINQYARDLQEFNLRSFALKRAQVSLPSLLGSIRTKMESMYGDVALIFDEREYLICGDRLRLGTVLENLIENAAQENSSSVITVASKAAPGGHEITVHNTGSTIPKEIAPHMFDLFTTGKEGGSGLGLAICKKIVEAHGGTIKARSNYRRSETLFTIFIPNAPLTLSPAEALSCGQNLGLKTEGFTATLGR